MKAYPPLEPSAVRLYGGPQDGALAEPALPCAPTIRAGGAIYRRTICVDRYGYTIYQHDPGAEGSMT